MAKTQTRRVKKQVFHEKLYKYGLGTKENPGALTQFATYGLLICVAFIFLYPLLYMIATSFMSLDDLLDVSVRWIPNQLDLVNYKKAWKVLDYPTVFPQTLLITILPSLIQTFICSVVAYGFARYKFKGKGFFLAFNPYLRHSTTDHNDATLQTYVAARSPWLTSRFPSYQRF